MKPNPTAAAPADPPDAVLARHVAAGDTAAFERLMRRHNRTMFRTARAILRDDAEAEDALQDAYLHAYRGIGGFRGESRFTTWLARIVANEALMRLRKRVRRGEIVPIDANAFTMEKTPERSAELSQVRRLLESQIDALPDDYRAVFMLRAVEEMSVEETAAVLSVPQATVRSRFFRARGLLREALASRIDQAYEETFAFAGERCDRIVASVMKKIALRAAIRRQPVNFPR